MGTITVQDCIDLVIAVHLTYYCIYNTGPSSHSSMTNKVVIQDADVHGSRDLLALEIHMIQFDPDLQFIPIVLAILRYSMMPVWLRPNHKNVMRLAFGRFSQRTILSFRRCLGRVSAATSTTESQRCGQKEGTGKQATAPKSARQRSPKTPRSRACMHVCILIYSIYFY